MKDLIIISLVLLFICSSCSTEEKKRMLAEKAAQLDRREQELQLRQQSLTMKEEELRKKEQQIDSASTRAAADTLARLYPGLPGIYNVTMRCTETTCQGSAVGDTKSEKWQMAIEENQVIVQAMSDQKVIRVYKGGLLGNTIELIAQADTVTALQGGNMIVRLQQIRENQLRGVREIARQDDCQITYSLDLHKQ
jgi:hypothetical protein